MSVDVINHRIPFNVYREYRTSHSRSCFEELLGRRVVEVVGLGVGVMVLVLAGGGVGVGGVVVKYTKHLNTMISGQLMYFHVIYYTYNVDGLVVCATNKVDPSLNPNT